MILKKCNDSPDVQNKEAQNQQEDHLTLLEYSNNNSIIQTFNHGHKFNNILDNVPMVKSIDGSQIGSSRRNSFSYMNFKKYGLNRIKRFQSLPDYYQINMIHPIASGAFGRVFKCQNYAIKIINLSKLGKNQKRVLLRETKVHMSIQHENIVKLYQYFYEKQNQLCIVLEYCQTDLLTYKDTVYNGIMDQHRSLSIFRQLLLGYRQLLKEGVVHRDLKPANILITKDNVAKLADFGFSRFVEHQDYLLRTFVGSPIYMPLQILHRQIYSSKSDIWSLGIILYEMICGQFPWTGKSQQDLINNIQKRPLVFPNHIKISKKIKDLLIVMLQKQQEDRISWTELFQQFSIQYVSNSPVKQRKQLSNKTIEVTNIDQKLNNPNKVLKAQQNNSNKQNTQNNLIKLIKVQQYKPKKYKIFKIDKVIQKEDRQIENPLQNYFKLTLSKQEIRYIFILQICHRNSKVVMKQLKTKLYYCTFNDLNNQEKQIVMNARKNFSIQLQNAIDLIYKIPQTK